MKNVAIAASIACLVILGLALGLFWLLSGDQPSWEGSPRSSGDPGVASRPGEDIVDLSAISPGETRAVASGETSLGLGTLTITGRVVDPGGDPVMGAEVALLVSDEALENDLAQASWDSEFEMFERLRDVADRVKARWRSAPRVASAGDGAFAFRDVGAGDYRAVARGVGYLPVSTTVVSVSESTPAADVKIELEAGPTLRGVVLTPGMEPVGGANVRARWTPGFGDLLAFRGAEGESLIQLILAEEVDPFVTAEDGLFTFSGLVAGEHSLQVEAEGFARTQLEDVVPDGLPLQVVLEPELVVAGQVIDLEEKPVPGAQVEMAFLSREAGDMRSIFRGGFGRGRGRGPSVSHEVVTDAQGLFLIRGLARGTYRASVERDGFQSSTDPFLFINQESSEDEKTLVFQLAPGHVIRGVVKDDEGETVADASVRLRWERELPSAEEAETQEDRQEERPRRGGRGGFGGRGDGPPRYMSQILERMDQFREGEETRTDASGAFAFTTLRAGIYRLEVRSSDHLSRTIRGVPTDGEPLDIQLEVGADLAGQVLDQDTDAPLALSVVRLYRVEEDQGGEQDPGRGRGPGGRRGFDRRRGPERTLRTDVEGRFTVGNLEGGRYTLRVDAAGYLRAETEPVAAGVENEVIVELQNGGALSGHVRDGSGVPAAGVRVAAIIEPEGGQDRGGFGRRGGGGFGRGREVVGQPTVTDEEGFFLIPLDRAGVVRVTASGEPYLPGQSDPVTIDDPTRDYDKVEITVQRSALVHGTVTGKGALAVANASVEVRSRPEEQEGESEEDRRRRMFRGRFGGRGAAGRTDALGRFSVSGLEAGRYEVVVRAPAHIDFTSTPFVLGLGEDRLMDVQVHPEMVIAGTVFGSDGAPLPSAEVSIVDEEADRGRGGFFGGGRRTLTSALGTYRIGKLSAGTYGVRALAEGYASTLVRGIAAGSRDVDIVLNPLGSLTGVALGAMSGMPVTSFRLRLEHQNSEQLERRERDYTERWRDFNDPQGVFAIDNLPPGNYTLQVDAPEYLPVTDMLVKLPVNVPVAELVIPVPEGGTLSGVVVDEAGQPVAGARLQAMIESVNETSGKTSYQPYSSSLRSGDDRGGRDLLAERFRPGRPPAPGSRGGDGGDASAPRGRMREARSGRTTSLEDGSFVVRGLPDATYRLRVTHTALVGVEEGPFAVESTATGYGGVPDLRVQLKQGATVRGRVLSTDGTATSGSMVVLQGGIERKNTMVDATGRFEIPGVGPGTYEVRVRRVQQREAGRQRGPGGGGRTREQVRDMTSGPVTVEITEKDRTKEVEISL